MLFSAVITYINFRPRVGIEIVGPMKSPSSAVYVVTGKKVSFLVYVQQVSHVISFIAVNGERSSSKR